MASDVLVTTASQSTYSGNINVSVQIRQETSSLGKVKLQGRLSLSWANYQDVYYTNNVFDIYMGSSTSGTKLLTSSPDWVRTASAGSTTTSWVNLAEISNTSSVSLYAVVKPNGSAARPTTLYFSFSVSGIKPTYSLSVSAGTGSTISVNRQSSGVASTGSLSSDAVLYYGDSLRITASPSANYGITSLKVNGSNFTSGNTHSVSGAVSVTTTTQVLASDIGATNADIESVSTITVTKYNSGYYHSIQYSFGGLSGYVTSNGGTSSSETKFTNASVAFTIPSTFYAKIPNSKTGTCTLTCRTYSSSSSTTVLGSAKTCTFTVTASSSKCAPSVDGTVVDTNELTAFLTGDSSKLIRYKSSAECTISASARNSATLTSKMINGLAPTNDKLVIAGDALLNSSFVFSATDSRGYSASTTKTPTMIPYVKLTANPYFYRPSPTSGEVSVSFSGNYYNGSFGEYDNQLMIAYRYRESTESAFGSWVRISNSNISISNNSYRSSSDVVLSTYEGSTTGFDYKKSYIFEFWACDGYDTWSSSLYRLSSISQFVTVKEGVPVFDWGKDDFRFNVPIYIGETRITEEQLKSLLALIS